MGRKEKRLSCREGGQPLFLSFEVLLFYTILRLRRNFLGVSMVALSLIIFEGERALMFFVPIMSGTLYEFP